MKGAMLAGLLVLAGCADHDTKTSGPIQGTLQIEVLDTIDVRIAPTGAETTTVTLTSAADFGLLPTTAIEGNGFAEAMPENGDTLYSGRISAPAIRTGPCGDVPISLALSLHRQGNNETVLGGISAYCGANTWYGVPIRVLRLAGPLPVLR